MKTPTLWKPTEFRTHPVSFSTALQRALWRGIVRHVYDGDSYAIFLDKGFFDYQIVDIRLRNVDTPEIVGATRDAGLAAKAFAAERLLDKPVLVRVEMSSVGLERRTFERYVADVIAFAHDTEYDFGHEIVAAGHGVVV